MTFPADHVSGGYRPEDHSIVSITLVSISMIAVALVGLSLVI